MDHSQSLTGQKGRSEHRRRHSLSRSLATWGTNSGKRMSGWVGKVYGSSPRGAPLSRPLPPPPLPPLPAKYPVHSRSHRLSVLSFSTPTLLPASFNVPLTPPPSPPISISSMETSFQEPIAVLPGLCPPPRVDLSTRLPTPPESEKSSHSRLATPEPGKHSHPHSHLQTPQSSHSRVHTPPLPRTPHINVLTKVQRSFSDLAAPNQNTQTPQSSPPDVQSPQFHLPPPPIPESPSPSSNLRHSHSRKRSVSASLADSFTLLGRRRRNNATNTPAVPLDLKILPHTPAQKPEKQRKRPSRRATSSPPPPPIPPKYPRNTLPVPISIPKMDSLLLPELSFSHSPLMPIPRAVPSPLQLQPKSPLRKRGSKVPGSPVRMGITRSLRSERRTLIMQPSERENREFTKQSTIKVQQRLAEVEAARMNMSLLPQPELFDELHAKLAVPDTDEKRDSYTSLDGILSSYASSSSSSGGSTEKDTPEKTNTKLSASSRESLRLSAVVPEKYAHLGVPPAFQLAIASPLPKKWQGVKQSVYTLPSPQTPVKDNEVYGGWDNAAIAVSASSSTLSLDIEVAFSSLGGFGSGGIWRKIGTLLEPWDLARLARVSKRVKRAVEPLLYESINLRPNYPHGFSYSYLSHLLSSLHSTQNKPKLQKWTKSFRLGKGWEENQIILLDNGAFLMDEEVTDNYGMVVVSKEDVEELIEEEGLLGDGGIKEVNAYMSDILERTPNLTSLTWDSPIPLRSQLISTIAGIKSISALNLNLSQPMRKERRRDGSPLPQWANLAKYRPNVQAFSTLPLVELRLSNLPTRGGKWWKQVWYLIAASVDTLRILALEMPHINHERYQYLFDRYHRIYHVPEHDEDERHLKTPPVFDWNGYSAAKKELGHLDKKLQIHTLELTGFVVDEKILNWEIQTGTLKNLVLLGCIERAGFRITKDCWRGIEVFRSTGLGFMERVLESLYTSTGNGKRKEICFLTDQHEHTEREALDMLRRVVINAFPRCGERVGRLVLKEQWALGKEELGKVFSGVCGAGGLTEMAVAVENSTDAWTAFLDGLGKCGDLRKVHVLNGFSYQAESGYGSGAGAQRRLVVNDAEAIVEALVEAWEQGSGMELEGFVVAVSRAAWRIMRIQGGKWGVLRIPGSLKEVIVGGVESFP